MKPNYLERIFIEKTIPVINSTIFKCIYFNLTKYVFKYQHFGLRVRVKYMTANGKKSYFFYNGDGKI